ncbi:trypsin inhibitor-like [Aphomia sociella]
MYKFIVFIAVMFLLNNVCQGDDICSLPLVTGRCRASFIRYGYDPDQCACVTFTYGGCGGNENNFETKEECENACVK